MHNLPHLNEENLILVGFLNSDEVFEGITLKGTDKKELKGKTYGLINFDDLTDAKLASYTINLKDSSGTFTHSFCFISIPTEKVGLYHYLMNQQIAKLQGKGDETKTMKRFFLTEIGNIISKGDDISDNKNAKDTKGTERKISRHTLIAFKKALANWSSKEDYGITTGNKIERPIYHALDNPVSVNVTSETIYDELKPSLGPLPVPFAVPSLGSSSSSSYVSPVSIHGAKPLFGPVFPPAMMSLKTYLGEKYTAKLT